MASINISYTGTAGEECQHALTLEQAVRLLAGKDFWRTQEMPELGLASLKWSDGPNGARGENWTDGKAAVCFPCATSLGATFDRSLVQEVGAAIATDSLGKHAYGLLAPTVNIHRYLLNGRNFESYSEDPLLSGYIAAAYINGVQSQGVSACPKHFLANEVENGRRWSDSVIDERTLREIYLEPFRILIRHSSPLALMTAYNACGGEYCSQSKELLEDIVRGEWGFKGLIVSDWFGTYSTSAALNAGLDLEMAGPTKFRTQKMIEDALASGELSIDTIAKSVQRLVNTLVATKRIGLADAADIAGKLPERSSVPDEKTISLLRRAAADGMVLLKNDNNTLPLSKSATSKLNIVGRPAAEPSIFGGGSASLRPAHISTPLSALQEQFPSTTYSRGVWVQRLVGLASEIVTPGSDLKLEWFNNMTGEADSKDMFRSETLTKSEYMMMEDIHAGLVDIQSFATRMTIPITAPVSGAYQLSLTSPGSQDAYLDGQLIASIPRGPGSGSTEEVVTEDYIFNRARLERTFDVPVQLEAGKQYELVIVSKSSKHSPKYINREFYVQGSRVGFAPVMDDEAAIAETASAIRAASPSANIVFVGTSTQWESEGFDRVSYALPLRQSDLILAVAAESAATGVPTVVFINSGSPVDCTPWINSVDAVVQAWFPGQEYGTALVDVLTGKVSPSGRLPTTVPRSIENTGAGDMTGKTDGPKGTTTKIVYKEGLSVGYRGIKEDWYSPLFAFGHGLSYSSFTYSDVQVENASSVDASVSVTVKNTGSVPAAEVVQLYMLAPESVEDKVRPALELRAFAKTKELASNGGEETVTLKLSRESFKFWDVSAKKWRVEAGKYKLLFAGSKGVGDWIDAAGDVVVSVPESLQWLD
ncbi:glycoside hydrolase superfamily [Microdochium trichocladiopsis]|uniref:beta-glucosidase n=1 Tax=Microdochium trichocladiopsis TaxID=1682393 RepID=A0A9P8YIF5_9PEZI|nr:glycoside hydrolase superfamily [Microdochium trichocladiopsis]KAH7039886.1 glycoside hydrolase superfamily [Microdochium trichocladiopsis]